MADVYELNTIADLLKIPVKSLDACLRDLRYALELCHFAGGEDTSTMAFDSFAWTDDGRHDIDMSMNGEPFLKLNVTDEAALSHAAGQDGEQCRAASGDAPSVAEQIELAKQVAPWFIAALGDLTQDYASMTVEDVELALRANGEYAFPVFRALSRGVAEDTRRMDWLVANVTEKLTAKSIQGEFPYPEHKTQYVLPRLIAWADFHGQVGFREAIDYAIADQRKEGE